MASSRRTQMNSDDERDPFDWWSLVSELCIWSVIYWLATRVLKMDSRARQTEAVVSAMHQRVFPEVYEELRRYEQNGTEPPRNRTEPSAEGSIDKIPSGKRGARRQGSGDRSNTSTGDETGTEAESVASEPDRD